MNPAKALIRRTGLRRSHVAAARMCCERNALATFGAKAGPRSRILCYHSVGTPAWGTNDVAPARFRRHIELAPGDALLDWSEIECLAAGGATIGSHSVTHPSFGRLERDAVDYELGASRRTIESRLGIVASSFAIPLGQSSDWTAIAGDVALATGYDTIDAQAEETRSPGTVPRTITRFDSDRVFRAALNGAFDRWEEWL